MPIVLNIGQGAGVAAALCARSGKEPSQLDVRTVQEVLTAQGVVP
jgi:hypothetical protein